MKTRRKNKTLLFLVIGVFLISGLGATCPAIRPLHAGPADHLVINEVSIDSIAGSGGSDDDWVEIYNPTDLAVDLSGWSIQKFAAAGTSINNQSLNGSVAPKSYFLIVRDGATTNQALKDAADLLAGDSFSLAANNIIYLVHNASNIVPSIGSADIVDFVGYGTASYYEGSAAAPNVVETKSITRAPDGNDTDNNAADFILLDIPTPNNSTNNNDQNINGNVLITITAEAVPVQNITPLSAEIAFQVNDAGTALVNYGLTDAFGNSTIPEAVAANTVKIINLTGLQCGTTYHYSIYAENEEATENDATADNTFATLPCGITINSLVMTKTAAKANNKYADGWTWEYDITVWDLNEIALKMKFAAWTGPTALGAAANMEYSADNGMTWQTISADNAYPSTALDLNGNDIRMETGRQLKIIVKMKVPVGTLAGIYNSSYGILTE